MPVPVHTGLDPAWIALVGTIFGGVGLKLVERWLGRSKERVDDATQIRDELRIEINSQRDEIKNLEAEVNRWRQEYYNLRDQHVKVQTELQIALERIKAENPPPPPIDPHLHQ